MTRLRGAGGFACQCLCTLAVLLLTAIAVPAAEPSDLTAVLDEANSLFRQANETSLHDPAAAHGLYQRAALRYERLVRDAGVRNGRLFYNAGNAWFLSDDVGRAILDYRRAQLYIPSDANLAQNLAYARSTRLDRFEEKQETRVLRTLLFWHYDLPPVVRSVLFALFSGCFWIAAAIRLRRRAWAPVVVLLVTGALAALFLGSLIADTVAGPGEHGGVILAQQVTARKGDGQSYEPSFTDPLHAGTEFQLVESRPDWYQIELPDGRRCWIPSDSAAIVGDI